MQCTLTLQGCDDATTIVMTVTPEQLAFLREVAARFAAASKYTCQPTLTVKPQDDASSTLREKA